MLNTLFFPLCLVLFQAGTVALLYHILSLLLVMPWWWTSSQTTTLLLGASMPPILHHHHVSPYARCCYLMPLTFKKKNRSCTSLCPWCSHFLKSPITLPLFGQGLSKYINNLKNIETRRNAFSISKCSGSVKVGLVFFWFGGFVLFFVVSFGVFF